MSLILDALKKLDREKSFMRKRTPDISDGILRSDSARPRRNLLPLAAVVAAGITLGAITGVGFFWKSSKAPIALPAKPQVVASAPQDAGITKPSPPPPPKTPAAPSRSATANAGPAVKSVPDAPPPSTKAKKETLVPAKPQLQSPSPGANIPKPMEQVPSTAGSSAATPSDAAPKASLSKPAPPVAPPPQAPPSLAERPVPPAASPKPSSAASVPPTIAGPQPQPAREPATPASRPAETREPEREGPPPSPAIRRGVSPRPLKEPVSGEGNKRFDAVPPLPRNAPDLKISGIVWHEEPSKRRAVINGNFTSEGSVVDGVTVVEIHPTKVRFSQNGRFFEVSAFH